MRNRMKITLLFILTLFSILSIGFASWSISSSDTSELSGTVSTDEVVKPEFITLSVVKKLMYSMNGFVGTDGNKMTVSVTVDLNECRKTFGDSKVKIDVYVLLDEGVTADADLVGSITPVTDSEVIDLSTNNEATYSYEVSFVVNFTEELENKYFTSGSPLYSSKVFAVEAKISVEE